MKKTNGELKIIEVPEKGGITIPDSALKKFGFKGMKLVLLETPEYITLKKIYSSSKDDLKKAVEDIRVFAKEKGITKATVSKAVRAVKRFK
ncbi:MAG: hypothetical protein HQ564_10370 [Candidatus Saganbacteria bacterium]|nr:hypothetical protein [Candidatus Saganbacteria bacterium]